MRNCYFTLVALSISVVLAAGASNAIAGSLSIEANLVVPDRSLKAHQTGPGLSVQWQRSMAAHWSGTVSTGYLTLLTKRTPSYQMIPVQGGIRWTLREKGHGPYMATDLGIFMTVESFRFRFAETIVADDDVAVSWGPGFTFGYHTRRLEGGVTYQFLLPAENDAGLIRTRCGYRF